MTGRLMMNALNKAMYQNLGGMGMLNDPNLLNMQVQGMNVGPTGGLRGLGSIHSSRRVVSDAAVNDSQHADEQCARPAVSSARRGA
jgi:hypothetical protein